MIAHVAGIAAGIFAGAVVTDAWWRIKWGRAMARFDRASGRLLELVAVEQGRTGAAVAEPRPRPVPPRSPRRFSS